MSLMLPFIANLVIIYVLVLDVTLIASTSKPLLAVALIINSRPGDVIHVS